MTALLRCCSLLLLTIAVPALAAGPEAPEGIYRYTVRHSLHGEVGSFTNVIRRQGDETVVDSRLRIAAEILGLVVHRVEEDRREVWRGGRLVAYESRADDDGTIIVTRGQAEGDRFVIDGPDGRQSAASGLYTTNPWSAGIAGARVLMGTQRGDLNQVTVSGGEARRVELDGRSIAARHYSIRGDLERELWYDEAGVLLKLAFPAAEGTVSFVLEEACGPPEQPGGPSAQC